MTDKRKDEEKDIDLYHKYYKQQRKKLGFDSYDDDRTYLGSALVRRPNLHPEVDGEYLRGLMPVTGVTKRNVLDVLEENCVILMTNKAAQGCIECKYTIPEIVPGLPHIVPSRVIGPLTERISKRSNITVYPKQTDEGFYLHITWKKNSDVSERR